MGISSLFLHYPPDSVYRAIFPPHIFNLYLQISVWIMASIYFFTSPLYWHVMIGQNKSLLIHTVLSHLHYLPCDYSSGSVRPSCYTGLYCTVFCADFFNAKWPCYKTHGMIQKGINWYRAFLKRLFLKNTTPTPSLSCATFTHGETSRGVELEVVKLNAFHFFSACPIFQIL